MSRERPSIKFKAAALIILTTLLLITIIFPTASFQKAPGALSVLSGSRYDVYHNSTWTVGADTWVNDTQVYLKADLVVDPGVKLTLVNSSIELDLDVDGKYLIQLGAGSWLTMDNSSIVNKTFRRYGFYGSGCTVRLYNSTIRGCGGQAGAKGTKGLELVNSDLYALGSNILMGDYGIYSTGGAVDLAGCNVSSHMNHGIYAERGSLVVENTLVTSNLKTGIWSRFADESLTGVLYKKGPMENNEMDLRVDRELTVNVKDKEGASLSEVDISVINNRSVRTDLSSGPFAQPVTFQLTWYTIHGAVENLYYPYQIIAVKNGHERVEDSILLDSNGEVSYILYPEGWFDSQLSAGLRAEGEVLEWNTTSWVEVNVSNSGYGAKNITVELSQDEEVVGFEWLEELSEDKWTLLNFSYTVKDWAQNLTVMVDVDGNNSEAVMGDNSDWVVVKGLKPFDFSIHGPRKVYLNDSVLFNSYSFDGRDESRYHLEFRWNVSGNTSEWKYYLGNISDHRIHFDSLDPVNISLQYSNFGLEGHWSDGGIIEVYEPILPIASFVTNSIELEIGGALFNFDATASRWYDFGEESGEGLIYYWFIDGGLVNLTGAETAKLFNDDGVYNVSLIVRDIVGRNSTGVWKLIVVKNQPPKVFVKYPEGSIEAKLPYSLHLSAANSTDPDDELSELTFTWRVGDDIYTGPEVDIIFDEPGDYEIILTVEDDDGARDNVTIPLTIKDSEGTGGADSLWGVCCVVGIIIIIVVLLIVITMFFIRNPEKLDTIRGKGPKVTDSHLKLNKGKRQDFLIIKHPRKDLYRKYELFNVMDDDDHTALCVVWESSGDQEWQIIGTKAGSKVEVIDRINLALDRDTGRKYGVDYWGNGKIISKNARDEEKEAPKDDGAQAAPGDEGRKTD